jgi:predicted DNA-binding transcriptional regulator YafY
MPFTFTELMTLSLSRNVFSFMKGTVFYQSVETLFEKVQSTLPPQTMAFLDRIKEIFNMEIRPYKDYSKFTDAINQINQAAMECRRIKIVYRSLGSKRDSFRKIDPYKIRFFEGTIYVIAFCHLRNEIRTFVVDRIKLLNLTDEKFTPPDPAVLTEYIKHGFKVMNADLYTIKILITPEWSRYVSEKIWHESQKTKKLDDGSLELTFRIAGLEEIKQWIMSLGPEAYVLEPEELRKMIRVDLRKTIFQYEGARATRNGEEGMLRKSDAGG